MTAPRRLLDGAGDDLEISLLQSARSDAPSRKATESTLVALGLSASVLAVATTASAASVAPAAFKAAGATGVAMWVKWVGIAAVGGIGAWGVLQTTSQHAAPPVYAQLVPAAERATPLVAPPVHEKPAAPVATAPDVAVPSEGAVPTRAAAPAQTAPAQTAPAQTAPAQTAPAQTAPSQAAAPRPAPTLGEELAALDRARAAAKKDPSKALAELDAYKSKYKSGLLSQEAEVLRIEALMAAGRKAQARAAAQSFLAKHPSSPMAQRVRSVLRAAR